MSKKHTISVHIEGTHFGNSARRRAG